MYSVLFKKDIFIWFHIIISAHSASPHLFTQVTESTQLNPFIPVQYCESSVSKLLLHIHYL